jgi:hypothetical protein
MASRPNIHAPNSTGPIELESYAGFSLAADRAIHAGQVWR